MCLPLKEIEAYLHYYAGRFQRKRFEHWELVNQAWIDIYDLEIPQYASAGVRWAMQRYIRQQYMQDHRGNTKSVIQSIDEEVVKNLFLSGLIAAPKDKRLQVAEDIEYAHCLLRNPNISLADRLLIDQRYFQDLWIKQIAKIHGCTKTNIIYKLNRIIKKLKYVAGAA